MTKGNIITQKKNQPFYSNFLNKTLHFDVLKSDIGVAKHVLLVNDGQDFNSLNILEIYSNFIKKTSIPLIIYGIHTDKHRLSDYGTSYIPDYKNRGNKATEYMNFIVKEFVPKIKEENIELINFYYCGFSLGGLSAFDISWENPELFSKVGVFSGSFWWRRKSETKKVDLDKDRILHFKINSSINKPDLKFWLQCGTLDEKADRNKNGVIDSIDDTLDIIKELKLQGYKSEDIHYEEVEGGEHNFETWHKVFPKFLEWLFS